MSVEVSQATDAAAAQAEWSAQQIAAQAALKKQLPPGVDAKVTIGSVSGLGDRAATIHASVNVMGHSAATNGIYVLTGATFFAFEDLTIGGTVASPAAMEAQAHTTLGRVG